MTDNMTDNMTDKAVHDSNELTDTELMRYSRQILLDNWDIEAQLTLKNSRIIVVGAGGLGCPVLQILARAGVGHIHIIDFDIIEISNLQRQVLFDIHDIGQEKSEVAYKKLQSHNELINITYQNIKLTKDNIVDIVKKNNADLILDCTDNFLIRDLINQTCVQLKIPLLSASAIGEVGQLALFDDFIQHGCYACIFGDSKTNDERNCNTSGVLASTVAIVASMQAQLALTFLAKKTNPITGQLLLWDGVHMNLRKIKFVKNNDCQICHTP